MCCTDERGRPVLSEKQRTVAAKQMGMENDEESLSYLSAETTRKVSLALTKFGSIPNDLVAVVQKELAA